MGDLPQHTTSAVDLFQPSNRFVSASRLYGRLHRNQQRVARYWWVILLILAAVLVPVGVFTATRPPVYESKAKMWMTGRLNLDENRLYTEELIDYLSTQAELLRSPVVQSRAVARLGPRYAPTQPPPPEPSWAPIEHVKQLWRSFVGVGPSPTPAAPAMPFDFKVVEASRSSMLELRARGRSAGDTQRFLDFVIEEYLAFKREHRARVSDRTVSSVESQVVQLANELQAQQEKLHAFQVSNNVVFLQEQGNSAGNYLALLNKQMANLRTELEFLRLLQPEQLAQLAARSNSPDPSNPTPGEIAARDMQRGLAGPNAELFAATQQIQLLKAKREELSRSLQPLHPKMVKLEEDIATQERLAQLAREEALRQLAQRRQTVELELRTLDAAFKEWDGKAIEVSRKMADYERIRQDLQRLQGAHDKLLGMIRTADVSRNVDQENMAVLHPATIAEPISPMLRNLGIAFAASLLAIIGVLYVLGKFDDRISLLMDLSDHLPDTVLGQIPEIPMKKPVGKFGREFVEQQRFEFLESFRNLRSSIMFMHEGGKRPQTILIASSIPKEGKTTVALYLSATLAMGGARVLVVDADMRRAKLHEHFGVEPEPGLAAVLEGQIGPAAAVQRTYVENVWLLAAGQPMRNPGDLVLSPIWPLLLQDLAPQYDYIIIDSPPLLATDDTAVLAPKVDGVLFTVRAVYTPARMVQYALNTLRQRKVRVLGLVLNRAASSRYDYDRYQRYGHSYRWEPDSEGAPRREKLLTNASTLRGNGDDAINLD